MLGKSALVTALLTRGARMTMVTRNLVGVSAKEVQTFIDSFDIVLSDCDGVLWDFSAPIDGAVTSLRRLQDLGKQVYFVTNNSVAKAEQYCMKIRKLGLNAEPEQVINTAAVISSHLKNINFDGEIFTIASTPFREILQQGGFKLAEQSLNVTEMDVPGALRAVQDRKSIKAIIVDADVNCNWSKMAFAISCLQRKDCLFFSGAADEWVLYNSDVKILGPGPMTDLIANQSGRTPTAFGKPSEILKRHIFQTFNLQNPNRCLFIGDTAYQDMKFGTLCGFQKLFVNTGCDRLARAQKSEDTVPDYYLPSLGDLNPLLDSLHKPSMNGVRS